MRDPSILIVSDLQTNSQLFLQGLIDLKFVYMLRPRQLPMTVTRIYCVIVYFMNVHVL